MSGPPSATAKFRCASGCSTSTISRSGPPPTAMCAPGLRTRPATAAPATSSRRRAGGAGDVIQQACPRLRRQARDQQFRQTAVVQSDRVRKRESVVLDALHRPPVYPDRRAEFVEIFLGGAVGVVALPAHDRTFL